MASDQTDSSQNQEVSTQESRLGAVDGAVPMGMSLTGENLTETILSVWKRIVYEVVDVNISTCQNGTSF